MRELQQKWFAVYFQNSVYTAQNNICETHSTTPFKHWFSIQIFHDKVAKWTLFSAKFYFEVT